MHLLEPVGQDLGKPPVALLHRDADAFAEIFRIEIGAAAELAAAVARRAVDPEGEPDAVAEHEVDRVLLERFLGVVGGVEGGERGAGEELLEICLVPGVV